MSSNKVLSIDLETFSDVDIDNGVYRYVDTPNFEILLLAYAFDDEPVKCIDLCSGESIPEDVLSALHDKSIEKHAFNATFERVCLSKHLGEQLSPYDNWWCTQAHAAMYGLPASLKDVAKALELSEQKDKSGTLLINYFSKPCKPSRVNGMRTRNYPLHDPMKWELFKKYCIQDVYTERAISEYLNEHFTKRLDVEKENYRINEEINDRGIRIDTELCKSIVEYNDKFMQDQFKRAQELTGLDNPNSLTQLKVWLEQRGLHNVDTITKTTIPDLIESTDDDVVKEVLKIRLNMSQTSITKYQKMLDAVCSDGRVHGVMKYYGANRTGRYSGRLIQTQNLPRNYMSELNEVRELVKNREWDYIESMYDDIPNIVKQLIRTAIIPSDGCVFGIADYSAIEARVSAWMAHETWVEEVFHGDGKIYEATASQMFDVPVETIAKGKENYELRQRGKVAQLACGYGGGVGAMAAMDVGHKIDPNEYKSLVDKWRSANPNIVRMWSKVENAAKKAITTGETQTLETLRFKYSYGCLFIQLPSKRWITYYKAHIDDNGSIVYQGNDNTRAWVEVKTFGGKLFENIIQAIARDCLADSIRFLVHAGFKPVFHVHDEIICELPKGHELSDPVIGDGLATMEEIMGKENGVWDKDLYHPAPGFDTEYYLKD